jgi:hypothetical protein
MKEDRDRLTSRGADKYAAQHEIRRRPGNLARFHNFLLERLIDEPGERLERVASHPGLEGPERDFFGARLRWKRGDKDGARKLMTACLEKLPGHRGFLAFAKRIGAEIPSRARRRP